MDKYNRNYVLLVQRKDGTTLQIKRPFTVEFEIHRNSLSSANVGQIRIFNLAPNNRSQIRKNQYDTLDLRTVTFMAGYGDNLSVAFTGSITQAWSVREGTNMVTTIESFDGGYAYVNAVTSEQVPGGTPQKSIVESLAASMPGVSVGAIGNYSGNIARGNTLSGSTAKILGDITGGGFFIDNGKVNCLQDNEAIDGNIPVINAQSGLLGTPVRETTYINFDMLFEPSLKVCQLIQLQSSTAGDDPTINGLHKVISIRHQGVISDAVCGSAITSVGLLPGVFTTVQSQSGGN